MKTTRRTLIYGMVAAVVIATLLLAGCAKSGNPTTASSSSAGDIRPAEARAIAKDAYIYGYSMVDSYRIQYEYFGDSSNPAYKGPWNHLVNTPRVYTPADRAFPTPNSDTPYSWLGMDLRAEPMVLTMPLIEEKRYFTVQLIDGYTYIIDYIGSRTTGNGGGSYLIALLA